MPNTTHFKGLKTVPHLHKGLFPGVNQGVAAEMVVPDEGLATPFVVTNKWSLAGRKEKACQSCPSQLLKALICVMGKAVDCLQRWFPPNVC